MATALPIARWIAIAGAAALLIWLSGRLLLAFHRWIDGTKGLTERNPGPPGSYHFIGWSLERMPDWFNRWGKNAGTSLCLWFLRSQRAASREYLRLILKREPTYGEMWQHFYGFTEYLCMRMSICQGGQPEVRFAEGHGGELRAWIVGGKPALYGTMHVGRSDLVGFFLCELGERVYMIRRQVGNSEDTRRLARRFERSVTFIWINDWSRLVLAMNDALRAGHSLAMQCDRPEYSSKHEAFHFLGERRVFPFTIYHLAIMHGMPVVLSYAVPDKLDPGKTIVHMPPMFFPSEERTREANFAAAREHFQAFITEIEGVLREEPYLWFNFLPLNPPWSAAMDAATTKGRARGAKLRGSPRKSTDAASAPPSNKEPASTVVRHGNGVLT